MFMKTFGLILLPWTSRLSHCAPFEKLFSRVGFEIIDAERINPQGGSIRIIAQKKGRKYSKSSSVDELIELEKKIGLNEIETLYKFEKKISYVGKKLQRLVSSLKADGKVIAGFGAPTKATTLMAHFGLDRTVIDFIVDDNPLKQGLFTPMTHIPVFSPKALYERKPDYVLILAWNFSGPIIKMHEKYSKEIGSFIVPMPTPKIC